MSRYLEALSRQVPLTQRQAEGLPLAAPVDAASYRPGQWLRHAVFGEGEVVQVEGDPADPIIEVNFTRAGRRRLLAGRAPIERLDAGRARPGLAKGERA